MDNLGILIQAILSLKDTKASKDQIASELPKLESQLQSDKNARIKIVAELDTDKSKAIIQSQLNTLANQTKAPTIKVGIDTSGLNSVQGSTQNITNDLKNVQIQAQQTSQSIMNLSDKFKSPIEPVFNNEGLIDADKTILLVQKHFQELGEISVKGLYSDNNAVDSLDSMIVKIQNGQKEARTLTFELDKAGKAFYLKSGTSDNSGVKKLLSDIEKANATAQKKLAEFNNKSMGLFNKTDVYAKALEASKDITDYDSISKFNNAMAELEAHYQKITAYTRSGSKSLNPFINAVNNMAGMEEQIKRIKASADGLQNKSKSLIGNLGSLNRLADNVNKHAVGTEEWGQAYEKLKNKIAQVNDQIKTAKVEQKTTDSFAQKQQNMYSVIEQRMKQINQLKIQQLSTDESTSRIIQEQINSYTNQINGIKGNMSKYKYGDKTLDNEVEKLKVELDYKYRIAQSEKENRIQQQSNNELLKFQTDTLREINAEYEKIVANKKAMASTKSEENKSIYANRIAESEKIIANDMEMLKDANFLTEEINQQVASKRQYVSEQEKIIANTAQIKREQELNQVFKSQITEVEKYKNIINETIDKLQRLQNSSTFTKNASNPQVTQTKQEISSLITAYQNLMTKLQGNITPAGLETVRTELTQLNARFNTTTATAKQFETELRNDNGAEKLAQRVALLRAQIEAYAKANPKAMKKFGDTFNSMIATLNSSPDKMNVDRVAKEFQTVRQEINKADLAGKTFFQNLKDKINKFTGWMSMTYAVSLVTRTIRSMITEVVNLDTALIDLKKTFKGTNSDLQDFYYEANNIAKQLGVTTEEVITQASAWSRLGYNTKSQIESLSQTSSIFAAISPEMDVDAATNTLVSVLKAYEKYGLKAEDALDGIASKVNAVGNNFAVSNSDIAEALQRSSASMASANTDLEHTIALITAGKFRCLYVQKCA